ncbi:MAG TPA: GNAT family N-acetyltransferase [Staphylococcus sp.]|nr:GNAT family N-acetyltransferase [Staphylococcus sp.]
MEFIVKNTEDLTNIELLHIIEERINVFVVEQECVYQEVDEADKDALHVILKNGNDIVAYTRVIDCQSYISFGRVLVVPKYRMQGYGREIVQKTIDTINERFSTPLIKISGQAHLKTFYESFGFQSISEIYLEDNIPHITFEKLAK